MESIIVPHGLLGKFTFQITESGFAFHESYRTKLVETIQQRVSSSTPSWSSTLCPNDTLSVIHDVQCKCIVTNEPETGAIYTITVSGSHPAIQIQVKEIIDSVLGISEFDGSIPYSFY